MVEAEERARFEAEERARLKVEDAERKALAEMERYEAERIAHEKAKANVQMQYNDANHFQQHLLVIEKPPPIKVFGG